MGMNYDVKKERTQEQKKKKMHKIKNWKRNENSFLINHTAWRRAILIFLSTASIPVTEAPIRAKGWQESIKIFKKKLC